MKSKFTRPVLNAVMITALLLGIASITHGADQQNATNTPTALATTITVDPYTSLPIALPAARWIDPNWQDSGQTLPDFGPFDGIPLSEVIKLMREKFKDAFDVVIPRSWQSPNVQTSSFDSDSISIRLHLKNVTATEAFNAMNLMFETENTPVRWELKMNGNRALALLRVVPALLPQPVAVPPGAPAPPPVEKKLMVFFVGNLVKSGDTSQLFKTVCEVYDMAYPGSQSDLKFHENAQLLIVNASPDRIDFVRSTLAALEAKDRLLERTAVAAKTKTEAPKKTEAAPEPNK